MSCLRLFDGHGVPLTEQAVPFVGRALRLSSTLVTLHLEGAALTGRPIMIIGSVIVISANFSLKAFTPGEKKYVCEMLLLSIFLFMLKVMLQILVSLIE